jgi:hypothetical protein
VQNNRYVVGSTVSQAPSSPELYQSRCKAKSFVEDSKLELMEYDEVVNELVHIKQQQRKDFEGVELAEMKDSAIPFDELLPATKEGVNPVTASRPINGKTLTPLKTKPLL